MLHVDCAHFPDELKFMIPAIAGLLTQVNQTLAQTSGRRGGHSIDYPLVECTIADAVAQIECAANQGARPGALPWQLGDFHGQDFTCWING